MKKSLQEKLKAYSAVAGSLVAVSANAQVNYTDISPDTMVHDSLVYGLDLNNDAVIDFEFATSVASSSSTLVNFATVSVVGDTNNAVLGSLYYGMYPFPYRLNNGDSIKPNSVLWPGYSLTTGVNYLGVTGPATYGNWVGITDKYLGLRIKVAGQFYYGWARLSVNATTDTITIKEYAIEALPNTPIAAGQITGLQTQNLNVGVRIHSFENALFVHTPSPQEGGFVTVYNMTGELIRKEEITSADLKMNLQGLAVGTYVVHVHQGDIETSGKVLIK